MDRINRFLFINLLVILLMTACGAQVTETPPALAATQTVLPGQTLASGELPQTEAGVPRISIEDAKAAFDNGLAVIVDVRSPSAFETSHVAGSISVPLGAIEQDPTGLDLAKEQWIITYCT